MSRPRSPEVVEIGPSDGYPVLAHASGVPPLAAADRIVDAADCDLILVDQSGRAMARCSCWWSKTPRAEDRTLGVIGHYAAADAASGSALLTRACARLSAAGCTQAVGPMDGTTWRRYRLVIHQGSEPPFFLEPWTPDAWLNHWEAAGFSPIAEYMSAVSTDLSQEDPRVERAAERLQRAGIRIRPLNATDPDRDLRQIFGLSLASFSRNFLYAPISEREFLDQNRRLLSFLRPELVLLAERPRQGLVGFLVAFPDILELQRQSAVETVIIKTVAVAPHAAAAGLGSVLVARAHRIARELGYRRAIHALMHTRNVSRNISRRYASTIRRYALLAKGLEPVPEIKLEGQERGASDAAPLPTTTQ